ncbi:MAG TPA: hypothetical protein VN924_00090 [Bryobacteraceae bacterium]|jgi:hypothetical protein|nr:hypothetical protein [Bryobacteraceae bacterium]
MRTGLAAWPAEKIANNERLLGEIAGQRAEEALYRDLGFWLNAGEHVERRRIVLGFAGAGFGGEHRGVELGRAFPLSTNETLGKVADAIQILQNGRRLIGVITHVQSLADQMPARIEIEKTLGGSRVLQATKSRPEGVTR